MKKIVTLSLTVFLLVAVVAGASVLYDKLTAEYQGDNLITDKDLISSQLGQQNKPDNGESTENAPSVEGNPDNNYIGGDESAPDDEGNGSAENENGSADNTENEETPSADNRGDNTEPDPDSGEAEKETEDTEDEEPPKNLAPDFTVLDENGREVKLSDFRGKPVVLNFWATWCGYCMVEMPDFNEAYKKYPEIQFLMVNATANSDTVEKAKKTKADNGYNFDIFFDTAGEAVRNYNVTGFPTTYFISAEGELIAVGRGMLNMATLEKGIAMILPSKKED